MVTTGQLGDGGKPDCLFGVIPVGTDTDDLDLRRSEQRIKAAMPHSAVGQYEGAHAARLDLAAVARFGDDLIDHGEQTASFVERLELTVRGGAAL